MGRQEEGEHGKQAGEGRCLYTKIERVADWRKHQQVERAYLPPG